MKVTEIKKDEDIILRFNKLFMELVLEFKTEQDRRSLADKESHAEFKKKIDEENQEDLHEDHASHSRYDTKKEEDILLRLNELFMDSVREFKAEQDRRNLAGKECNDGFKQKIEEENQEVLYEDASHSRYDTKKEENILLRLKELFMDAVREFKAEQDRRNLAGKESNGGFKHKIEEENQEDFHDDASHSRYDIKEDEDIILQLNEPSVEPVRAFKTEQDRRSLADKENHGGSEHKIEEENQKDLCENKSIKEYEDIIFQLDNSITESVRVLRKYLNGLEILAGEESDGGLNHKIEEDQDNVHEDASHSRDIKEDEDIILRLDEPVMESVRESENAADKFKKEQTDLHGDLNGHQSLADEESDGGFKHKIEENAEDLHTEASSSHSDIKKALINEDLEESNGSDVEGLQVRTIGTLTITELNDSDVDSAINPPKENDASDSAINPLKELEDIVVKLSGFVDRSFSKLKFAQKVNFLNGQDKLDFLENVRHLLLTSSDRMHSVLDELKRVESDENPEEDSNSLPRKTQIPEGIVQQVQAIAHSIESCFHHAVSFLFHDNCAEKELLCCLDQLNRSRENLRAILTKLTSRK